MMLYVGAVLKKASNNATVFRDSVDRKQNRSRIAITVKAHMIMNALLWARLYVDDLYVLHSKLEF